MIAGFHSILWSHELKLANNSCPHRTLPDQVGAHETCHCVPLPGHDGLQLLRILREHHTTFGISPSAIPRPSSSETRCFVVEVSICKKFTSQLSHDDPGTNPGESFLGQAASPFPRIHFFSLVALFTVFHQFQLSRRLF